MSYNKLMKDLEKKYSGNINNKDEMVSEKKKSWFINVPTGYTAVGKNIFGTLKVKEAGLRFFGPTWLNVTFIPNKENDQVIDLPKKGYKSAEGFDIIVDPAITYNIVEPKKFLKQENALERLKDTVDSILDKVFANTSYTVILDKHVSIADRDEFEQEFKTLEEKYGIKFIGLNLQHVELTGKMKESKEANILNKEKNAREMENADNKRKIADIEYERKVTEGRANTKIITDFMSGIRDELDKCKTPAERMALLSTAKAKIVSESDKANLHFYEGTFNDNMADQIALADSNGVVRMAAAKRINNKNKKMKLDRNGSRRKFTVKLAQNPVENQVYENEEKIEENGRSK